LFSIGISYIATYLKEKMPTWQLDIFISTWVGMQIWHCSYNGETLIILVCPMLFSMMGFWVVSQTPLFAELSVISLTAKVTRVGNFTFKKKKRTARQEECQTRKH